MGSVGINKKELRENIETKTSKSELNYYCCYMSFFLKLLLVSSVGLSIFLHSLQVLNPSLCMRTFFAQSATDWPKAQPALRGGSACPALR